MAENPVRGKGSLKAVVPLMMMMMNLENHLCHQTHLEVYNGCET
jgi:hypothetical protein